MRLSNAEIDRELYISDTTVKTHATEILQELDLRDRVQAVVLATRLGFDTDPAPPFDHGEQQTSLTATSADGQALGPFL